MLVYGIQCTQESATQLPKDLVTADYYTDYGLLVFPAYTRPTAIVSQGPRLTPEFWHTVRLIVQDPTRVYAMDLEQPYVSDAEAETIKHLQSRRIQPDWYHVPRTADTNPHIVVSA